MLKPVFEKLDQWIDGENEVSSEQGSPSISAVEIIVIGQTALMEARLSISIATTMDVDTYNQFEYRVKVKFEELLKLEGRSLDPVGHEAWMPEETEYKKLYEGAWVQGSIAEPVYVILSKAKMAPKKNKNLIIEYLGSSDLDQRIFALGEKYKVNFSDFL